MHLTNWKARRAGGRITINGTGEDRKPAKIVGVDSIVPGDWDDGSEGGKPYCVATDKNGETHRLIV